MWPIFVFAQGQFFISGINLNTVDKTNYAMRRIFFPFSAKISSWDCNNIRSMLQLTWYDDADWKNDLHKVKTKTGLITNASKNKFYADCVLIFVFTVIVRLFFLVSLLNSYQITLIVKDILTSIYFRLAQILHCVSKQFLSFSDIHCVNLFHFSLYRYKINTYVHFYLFHSSLMLVLMNDGLKWKKRWTYCVCFN